MANDLIHTKFRYSAQSNAALNAAPLSINTVAPQFTNPTNDIASDTTFAPATLAGSIGIPNSNFTSYRINFTPTLYYYNNLLLTGYGTVIMIADDPAFFTAGVDVQMLDVTDVVYMGYIGPLGYPSVFTLNAASPFAKTYLLSCVSRSFYTTQVPPANAFSISVVCF